LAHTAAQRECIEQLPEDGSWGTPRSTTHNGTLAALIRKDLVEWSGDEFDHVWELNYGRFRLNLEALKDEEEKDAIPPDAHHARGSETGIKVTQGRTERPGQPQPRNSPLSAGYS
jgi:hypothetical protein